jgi:signal transduction histidine kinase
VGSADVNGVASGSRARGGGSLPGLAPERLSHELRTPLNAILGGAELLLDGSAGPLTSQARACVGDIQLAGRRMLRHVQLLLDLCHARSRPEIASDTTADLVELLRAAHAGSQGPGPVLQVVPADARYLVRGEAPWLSVLAAALVELYRGDGEARGPLRITIGGEGAPACRRVLWLWWPGFDPDQLSALPAALIDAILDLHGAVVALTRDGLALGWSVARGSGDGVELRDCPRAL